MGTGEEAWSSRAAQGKQHPCRSSEGVRSLTGKHSRHGLDDATDPRALFQRQFGVRDALGQSMEDREGPVISLGCRDLVETAVRREGQEPPLLAGDCPPVVQVPFVAHDDDGHLLLALPLLGRLDELDLEGQDIEAGAVADAVDQDKAVCPLDSLLLRGALLCLLLGKEKRVFFIRLPPSTPAC